MVKHEAKVTLQIMFNYQSNKSLKRFLSGKHMLKAEVKDPFEIC